LELIYTGLYDKVDIEEEIKPIDLVGYKQAGDGFTSLTYFHEDGDKMLKVYYPFMSLDTIKEEKRRAVETIKLGISTPICSSVVKVNDSYGIIFERITDKKSISKLISEGEIPTEELAEIMATEIKKVHSTQCNTALFPNRKKLYLEFVKKSPLLNEEEKSKILKWIKTIPDAETCIHGDFHTGNLIIKSDKSAYFIDMGDFGYGDPRFDLGDFCFNVNNPLEDNTKFYYHNDPDTLKKFFKLFIKKYYEIENDEEVEKTCEDMKRFGALTVIYYSVRIEPLEWMRPIIVEWLLNTI